ncbi:MAG: hypothetical protein KDK54_19705 [Leptospiraceae bacterium]|nr:hypothetical protein [Leptospiraceae bacterium]
MKQSDLIINETIDLAERYMSITEQILEDFKNGNGNLNKLFLIKFNIKFYTIGVYALKTAMEEKIKEM